MMRQCSCAFTGRVGGRKSYEEVAWLKKDSTAQFNDDSGVNRVTIDNQSYFTWQTKVPKISKAVQDHYEEGEPREKYDRTEFSPAVSSTPVKENVKELNRELSRIPDFEECGNNYEDQDSLSGTPKRRKPNEAPSSPGLVSLEKGMDDETDNYPGHELSISTEELLDVVQDYLVGDNAVRENNEPQWQNELTECDACQFKGRIANHLRRSAACLKELRARPDLRMKGTDEVFILKTALIIGECPSPYCQSGRHEEIPDGCVSWWKLVGWDILGWRGDKADADGKAI